MTKTHSDFKKQNRVTVVFDDNIVAFNGEVMSVDLATVTSKVPEGVRTIQWWEDDHDGFFEYEDGTNEEITDRVFIQPYIQAFLDARRAMLNEQNKPENLKRELRVNAIDKINQPITVAGEEFVVDETLKDEFLELALGTREDNETVFLTNGSLKPVTNQELRQIFNSYIGRKKQIRSKLRDTATDIDQKKITDRSGLRVRLTEI